MNWYRLSNGRQEGPYSDDVMVEMIASGQLRPEDCVWRPGLVGWTRACDVPDIIHQVPASPSAPPPDSSAAPSALPTAYSTPDVIFGAQPPALPASSAPALPARPAPSAPAATGLPPLPSTVPPQRKASYIRRHFRGELPLATSFWFNYLFLYLALATVLAHPAVVAFGGNDFRIKAISLLIRALLLISVYIWQMVGAWRSARAHWRRGAVRLWAFLAYLFIALHLVFNISLFARGLLPQAILMTRLATGHDPAGTYQLRLLRNDTELEISGTITIGLTDAVRKTLDAHPGIHTLHLNTDGGRIGEGRKLRELIAARGLTTFASSNCSSAATLAFVAGKRRLIERGTRLGFHQYTSALGSPRSDLLAEMDQDKQDWLARGISRAFVEKAFATPNDDMWYPTHKELFDSGFATGYADPDEVAMSGVPVSELANLEKEFDSEPIFAALKEFDRARYDQFVATLRSGLEQGKSRAELHAKLLPLASVFVNRALPYASDAAVRGFTGMLLEQWKALYDADPELCYIAMNDPEKVVKLDQDRYFSPALRKKQFASMTEVLRSAAAHRFRPPSQQEGEALRARAVSVLVRRYGRDVQKLSDPAWGKANKARFCVLIFALFQEFLNLPEAESGAVLRYISSTVDQ